MTPILARRLTGKHLLTSAPGALLEVELPQAQAAPAIAAWRGAATRMLAAVGWSGEQLVARHFRNGVAVVLTAPLDALYAATELNEWAWQAAQAVLAGRPAGDFEEAAERLRQAIARERRPALMALAAAARARGVAFLVDDEQATVGLGRGSRSWPLSELPPPEEVGWDEVHDVPLALVTGTNGKTTTVRMVEAMLGAAGLTAGSTSTDRVVVAGEVLRLGDYAGSEGARLLLRDRRVQAAVLEVARGGLWRRGTPVRAADAAAVTNVAADHLGGVATGNLAELAALKLTTTTVVRPGGRAVLNADDPLLTAIGNQGPAPVTWFSVEPEGPARGRLAAHVKAGGDAALLVGEELRWVSGGRAQAVASIADVPAAHRGAARYNLANALTAIAVAVALGVSPEAMAGGLRRFGKAAADNPGRGRLLGLNRRLVLVDYAHNPHGLAALAGLISALPATRKLVLLGQAGDRSDEAIRELAQVAWSLAPDRIVIKELPTLLRGRRLGEIPALLADEFRRLGVPAAIVELATDELAGAAQALAWSQPGDLLVLLTHTQRDAVISLLKDRGAVDSEAGGQSAG